MGMKFLQKNETERDIAPNSTGFVAESTQ